MKFNFDRTLLNDIFEYFLQNWSKKTLKKKTKEIFEQFLSKNSKFEFFHFSLQLRFATVI